MKVARLFSGSPARSLRAARFLATAFVALTLAALSGCGGFSTEDAEARCDQEEEARTLGGCFNAVAYDACVVAYEECGDDVDIGDGCPLTFTCPE